MISIKNLVSRVVKACSNEPVVNGISCTIPVGRITTILGASGAGKTTLLRCIAGLEDIVDGSVIIDGAIMADLSIEQRSRLIGFVFQDFNLFPHLTAFENCMQPLIIAGVKKQEAGERVQKLFEQLDIIACKSMSPARLSGGQKQRVALVRALCLEPKALLLDEPSSALDGVNSRRLADYLKQLCMDGMTVVVVSQDTEFITMIRDNVIFVDEGKVS